MRLRLCVHLTLAAAVVSGPLSLVDQATRHPPVLTSFALNDGAATTPADAPVVLTHTVVGTTPAEYRVSARADFAGAAWLPYVPRPQLANIEGLTSPGCVVGGASRRLRLFLQVRARLGDEVRIVNGQRTLVPVLAESNVLGDSICASPHPSPGSALS